LAAVLKELTSGHKIMCHLPDDVLSSMEPAIAFKAEKRAVDELIGGH
jgi:hypothetical protein